MKKILVLGFLVVLSSISLAQKISVSTLVERSLANGRGNSGKGYYMIRVPQNVHIPHDEFRAYMKQHNYCLVQASNWAVGNVTKFGGTVKTVVSADFLPDDEIAYYLAGIRTSDAKRGKAYLVLEAHSSAMNVVWDGQLSNGYIDGYGSGVVYLGNRQYYLFTGNFHNGIATGNFTLTLATAKVTDGGGAGSPVFHPNNTKKTTKTSYFVSDFIDGYAQYSQNNKWGFIDQYANIVVKPTYEGIVSSFNPEGYAIVLNNKREEIKVNKHGTELGYSDHQAAIYEEQRLATEREKYLAERKTAEINAYTLIKHYYESFNFASFANAYNEYMKEYSSDNADHRIELEKMNATVPSRENRIAAGKDIRKWHVGSQICLIRSDGIMHAIVEKINGDQTFAEVKVLASPSGEYNGQEVKKNRTIWIQKNTGWHLALDEEVSYAKSYNSVRDPDEKCSCCTGKGYNMCTICSGTGRVYYSRGGYDKDCDYCKGSGHRICGCCNGTGR